MKRLHFPQFLLVCLCSKYVEFFVFSISKLERDFKMSNLPKAVLLWAKWDLKEEFDAKTRTKNLAPLFL
jgi:hypothetical protein